MGYQIALDIRMIIDVNGVLHQSQKLRNVVFADLFNVFATLDLNPEHNYYFLDNLPML